MQNIGQIEKYLANLPCRVGDYESRLGHVRHVLHLLGDPQNQIPAIHIAGTSGKGSTAYYCSELLRLSGYSVGLTVSPHVDSVSERAMVNGRTLPIGDYVRYFNYFCDTVSRLGENLTYIEFLDIFAYWLFAELRLDYIVIEVGLGGRLDPTNVITRSDKVAVITDIGLDHTEILGDTLTQIAREKAGIIGNQNLVCMHRQGSEVMSAIRRAATQHHAKLLLAKTATTLDGLPIFQQRNWSLARLAVATRLQIDNQTPLSLKAESDSLQINIPGRFEIFQFQGRTLVLDSAHNPQKISALVKSIEQKFPNHPVTAVVSFGSNKSDSASKSLRILGAVADNFICTEFTIENYSGHRAIPAETLASYVKNSETIPNPTAALDEAIALPDQPDTIILITGSFYLVSNLRPALTRRSGKTV